MTVLEFPKLQEPRTTDEPEDLAHIIAGGASVTEAYVMGTPVTALCGYVFIPSRDPLNLPICEECQDIFHGLSA